VNQLIIDGSSLTLETLNQVRTPCVPVALAETAKERMLACRQVIQQAMNEGQVIYGVNTGFGKFSDVQISFENLEQLQENLVLSHAAGVGKPLLPEVVRMILLLKANTLAKGYSGCRPVIVEYLLKFLAADMLPVIPEKGSVGASGDLAPLAHLVLPLIGLGEAFYQGRQISGKAGLEILGLEPIRLQAKEGLALLNGTQVTTALACLALLRLKNLMKVADIIGAMSLEALKGTPTAFEEKIHQLRGLPGQIQVAANLRKLLNGSHIVASHRNCSKIQDAYSLRCMPQVHGTVRDSVKHIESILAIEINSVTDNPIIFLEEKQILSGGNFHAQPISMAGDILAIAATQLANISERRIEYMLDPSTSCMAGFLTEEGGLNSGFMLAQVTAASLVSENKILAHPASVDSIPTSANKEDFVSMGTHAARKALEVVSNSEYVLAIELLCATQGMDFKKPLVSSSVLVQMAEKVRGRIPHWDRDRYLAPEIEKACELIRNPEFLWQAEKTVGAL
jgi:histidine ammonia-lyase